MKAQIVEEVGRDLHGWDVHVQLMIIPLDEMKLNLVVWLGRVGFGEDKLELHYEDQDHERNRRRTVLQEVDVPDLWVGKIMQIQGEIGYMKGCLREYLNPRYTAERAMEYITMESNEEAS